MTSRTDLLPACLAIAALLAGCTRQDDAAGNASSVATTPTSFATAAAAPAPGVIGAGFDPAAVPMSTASLGVFPFFGLIDGYVPLSDANSPSSFDSEHQKDAGFDRYEFFDGTKLVPVEGRLRTIEAIGKGASFLQAARNYAALVREAGGVTVFEGSGRALAERQLTFTDPRFRARYNMLPNEQLGVYMLRTPTAEIWIEVYNAFDQKPDNYWLTIVQKQLLDVTAKLVPAAAMKRALDDAGHVALYINFDTGRTAIKPDSQAVVAEIARLLATEPTLRLTIEGHTDNAGTPARNETLSVGRARAVLGALAAQGIDPTRLRASGLGQTRPIADNQTDEGRAQNRRVELVKQ